MLKQERQWCLVRLMPWCVVVHHLCLAGTVCPCIRVHAPMQQQSTCPSPCCRLGVVMCACRRQEQGSKGKREAAAAPSCAVLKARQVCLAAAGHDGQKESGSESCGVLRCAASCKFYPFQSRFVCQGACVGGASLQHLQGYPYHKPICCTLCTQV